MNGKSHKCLTIVKKIKKADLPLIIEDSLKRFG